MKQASTILCFFAVLVQIFWVVLCFSGFFGLVYPMVFEGIVYIIIIILGVSIRVAVEDSSPIGAGVVTMIFLTSFGLGIISGVLLICEANKNRPVRVEARDVPGLDVKPTLGMLYERYEKLLDQMKNNYISGIAYEKERAILASDVMDFISGVNVKLNSIQNRYDKGVLTPYDYNREVEPVKKEIEDANQLLAILKGNKEIEPTEGSHVINLTETLQSEIARLEYKLSLDESKKNHFESYKNYYEKGVFTPDEYLDRLRQLNPERNIKEEIEDFIVRIEANVGKKDKLEVYKNYYARGFYSDEEYYIKLKELYML